MTPTTEDFVTCRAIGHAWDELGLMRQRGSVWTYRLELRCTRCTTSRIDAINAIGDVGQREYRYPEGYKYASHETPSRREFRVMMIKRRGR